MFSFAFSFKEVLKDITSSKIDTIKFLQEHGVIAKDKTCPGPLVRGKRLQNCGQAMILKEVKDRKDGITWRCRKTHSVHVDNKQYKVKDVKVSIRENTWISDSNLTLELIVELMYLWANGFSNEEILHELKLSRKTLIEWSTYLRDICMYTCMANSTKIGGPGIEVEIDESKFGRRKYYRGKRVDGRWVFGGRETYDKTKIFMVAVKNRKAKTLLPIIRNWIHEGSIIHSDCWKSYNSLSRNGYTHVTVNHSKQFVNPSSAACTNRIECEWRHAKASLPSYGVKKGHHDGYLARFLWHRRFTDCDKFLKLIEHCNLAFKNGHFACIQM